MFPSNVRDRLLEQNLDTTGNKAFQEGGKTRLKNFLDDDGDDEYDGDEDFLKTKPIADLFPEVR